MLMAAQELIGTERYVRERDTNACSSKTKDDEFFCRSSRHCQKTKRLFFEKFLKASKKEEKLRTISTNESQQINDEHDFRITMCKGERHLEGTSEKSSYY